MVRKNPGNYLSVAVFLTKKQMDQLAHLSIDKETTRAELAAAIVGEYLSKHSRGKR